MALSETISDAVLDWRFNAAAINAPERLLVTLYARVGMLGDLPLYR